MINLSVRNNAKIVQQLRELKKPRQVARSQSHGKKDEIPRELLFDHDKEACKKYFKLPPIPKPSKQKITSYVTTEEEREGRLKFRNFN